MKIFSVITILLLAYFSGLSQETFVRGVLYEHNSKTNSGTLKPISNAQILVTKSVPCTSDNTGKFKTRLDGYEYGQTAQISVRKPGYEVVNVKELENYLVGGKDEVRIFLAPQNMLYEAQMKYYNIAKKSIEAGYNEKLNRLTTELKNFQSSKLNSQEDIEKFNQEFQKKSKEFENQRKTALKNADEIAKRIAEINLDFAEKTYKQAVGYFVMGNIDSCLVLLNSKYFSEETNKTLSKIGDLKNSIKEEVSNVERIIDREIFRAQLYQTKFQQDSVSQILQRISSMSFKLIESLDVASFLSIQKRVIEFDPFYSFSWIDSEYFEDLVAIVRIKAGRNSLADAEALRLFGVYKMRIGENEISRTTLLKSLDITRRNNSSDSAMVLTNLLEHDNLFLSDAVEYKNSIFYIHNSREHAFLDNPYWIEFVFKDKSSIEYAISVILKHYEKTGQMYVSNVFLQSSLYYVLKSRNIRDFSTAFVNNLLTEKLKNSSNSNTGIQQQQIDKIVGLESKMNLSSIDYVNFMSIVSTLYLDEVFSPYYRGEDNFDSIIYKHINQFYFAYVSDIYLNNLQGKAKFDFELSKCVYSFLLFSENPNLVSIDQVVRNFEKVYSLWAYQINNGDFGIAMTNLYTIFRLKILIYGCMSSEDQKLFYSMSESLARKNLFAGVNIFKYFVTTAIYCDDNLGGNEDLINYINQLTEYVYSGSEKDADSLSLKFGLGFSPNFEGDESEFDFQNLIDDFYFGSEYGKNVGVLGCVDKLNKWSSSSDEISLNSDSLWQSASLFLSRGDFAESSLIKRRLLEVSLPYTLNGYSSIDSLQFVNGKIIYSDIKRRPSSPSQLVWTKYGNSRLEMMDFCFMESSKSSDAKFDYLKCANNLKEFIRLGLPDYCIGYSKFNNVLNSYVSHIYFYGLKSALIIKDEFLFKNFVESMNLYLDGLSTEAKINFLNEFFWDVFLLPGYKEGENIIRLDFDVDFFNGKYKEFYDLIRNNSRFLSANTHRDFEVPGNISETEILEFMLTISLAPNLSSYNVEILNELRISFPNEPRVYRNAAYYYFSKGQQKLAFIELDKAIGLGFRSSDFFTGRAELSKYHKKIAEKFVGLSDK